MSKRRSPGEGGLSWDEKRHRWIASVSVGYDGRGKRKFKRASAKTKTEAKAKLDELRRQVAAGEIADAQITVEVAVEDWLAYGLGDVADSTRTNYEILCRTHIIPLLGAYKLRDLRTRHVDEWLDGLSSQLSTRTLKLTKSLLSRTVRRAQAKDQVVRNVVEVASLPSGRPGRPSKSLTIEQAQAILDNSVGHPFYAYIVVSLLTGARTEEIRALTWGHTHLGGGPRSDMPYIDVWRSDRHGGDTKTHRSRRSLALPARAVTALEAHRATQDKLLGDRNATDAERLVFCHESGHALDATSARWHFRRALDLVESLNPEEWTPRELRHSFVSILSANNVPIEQISDLVGHSSVTITETVYRKEIQPEVKMGAIEMDTVFRNQQHE